MTDPYLQLRDCAASLLEKWGYDSAEYRALKRIPRLANGPELAAKVYRSLRREGLGSNDSIRLRLEVDKQGRASRCTVQHPRRGSEIETLICDHPQDGEIRSRSRCRRQSSPRALYDQSGVRYRVRKR